MRPSGSEAEVICGHSRGLRLARPGKARPGRLDQPQRDAAGDQRRCARKGVLDAIEPQRRKPAADDARAHHADILLARHHRDAGLRRRPLEGDGNHARAGGAAVLDARDDLLADEAALGEIDALELIHVGLVREGIAVDEVGPAARHPERDAVRLIVRGRDQFCADAGRCVRGECRRQDATRAQFRQARVAIAQARFGAAAVVPDRQNSELSDKSEIITLARSL